MFHVERSVSELKKEKKSIAISTIDFLVSGESFNLVYDEQREILITSPIPKTEDLSYYYESEDYISHTDSNKGLMSSSYQLVKKYSLALKLRLVRSLKGETGKLLDIGAGTGEFMKLAQENNWEAIGVEPNAKARNIAQNKDVVLFEDIGALEGKQFDVVTLWHVLEHLPDLEQTIIKIEALIKPGGVLIVAVPNFRSFDAKHYKKYWAAYDVPRHLWHFSKASMEKLFPSKIKLIKIKPMIFDSFYVSLLSEKYKSGRGFSIKALFVGLWSNIAALRTGESSSLIYCFKKET